MGCIINVIGCDGVTIEDASSEDMPEYIECKHCLDTYNDIECKTVRIDMELILIFG